VTGARVVLKPFRQVEDGVLVMLRIIPKTGARVRGLRPTAEGDAEIVIGVDAAPEGGKANQALVRDLAKALKVPKSAIEIVRGAKTRRKTILVRGKGEAVLHRFEAWLKDKVG
jgi:uncharacterized protein (TIGR00251 family)